MAIQKIKATKTASLTDLRNPREIINSLADGRVAIFDRNKIVAYLSHPSQDAQEHSYLEDGAVKKMFKERKKEISDVLDYLKDK